MSMSDDEILRGARTTREERGLIAYAFGDGIALRLKKSFMPNHIQGDNARLEDARI